MKLCYDQGCNDIGGVIAKKWLHHLFHLQQHFSALGTVLLKLFTGAFSSIAASMFVQFKRYQPEPYGDILGRSFYG